MIKIRKLLCVVLGHRYALIRRLSHDARHIGCLRCRQQWGMHDSLRILLPWDSDLAAIYDGRDL